MLAVRKNEKDLASTVGRKNFFLVNAEVCCKIRMRQHLHDTTSIDLQEFARASLAAEACCTAQNAKNRIKHRSLKQT